MTEDFSFRKEINETLDNELKDIQQEFSTKQKVKVFKEKIKTTAEILEWCDKHDMAFCEIEKYIKLGLLDK